MPRVLFVEDDLSILQTYIDLCMAYGIDGVFADTYDWAMNALQTYTKFDLIVLDHRLRGAQTGEDVYSTLRAMQQHADTPVVAASTLGEGAYPGATKDQKVNVRKYLRALAQRPTGADSE